MCIAITQGDDWSHRFHHSVLLSRKKKLLGCSVPKSLASRLTLTLQKRTRKQENQHSLRLYFLLFLVSAHCLSSTRRITFYPVSSPLYADKYIKASKSVSICQRTNLYVGVAGVEPACHLLLFLLGISERRYTPIIISLKKKTEAVVLCNFLAQKFDLL